MKFIFLLVVATSIYSFAETPKKYPFTAESIRCLVLASGVPQAGKYIEIEKIYSDPKTFAYGVAAGVRGERDFGSYLEVIGKGHFAGKTDISNVEIQVEAQSLDNFMNPSRMEPFVIKYSYDNSFFNTHDRLDAKCLHRIF